MKTKEEARLARQRALEAELARRTEQTAAKLRIEDDGKSRLELDRQKQEAKLTLKRQQTDAVERERQAASQQAQAEERARQAARQQAEIEESVARIAAARLKWELERSQAFQAAEPTIETSGKPGESYAATPAIRPREEVAAVKAGPPAEKLDEAGDYIIRLHNVGMATSAGLREFIRRTPGIKLVLLSTCEADIQLNIKLEGAIPLVQALSQEFTECKVGRAGRIILIKRDVPG